MPDDINIPIPRRLEQPFTLYITAKEAEGCTPRTLDLYSWVLNAFTRWLAHEGLTDVSELTPHTIRHYLVKLGQEDLKASYLHLSKNTIDQHSLRVLGNA